MVTEKMIEAACISYYGEDFSVWSDEGKRSTRNIVRSLVEAALAAREAEPAEWQRFVDGFGWQRVNDEDVAHYRDKGVPLRPLYAHAPAEKAEPVCWQPLCEKWKGHVFETESDAAERAGIFGGGYRPLYAHPPAAQENVEPIAWLCSGEGDGWKQDSRITFDREEAEKLIGVEGWTVKPLGVIKDRLAAEEPRP